MLKEQQCWEKLKPTSSWKHPLSWGSKPRFIICQPYVTNKKSISLRIRVDFVSSCWDSLATACPSRHVAKATDAPFHSWLPGFLFLCACTRMVFPFRMALFSFCLSVSLSLSAGSLTLWKIRPPFEPFTISFFLQMRHFPACISVWHHLSFTHTHTHPFVTGAIWILSFFLTTGLESWSSLVGETGSETLTYIQLSISSWSSNLKVPSLYKQFFLYV